MTWVKICGITNLEDALMAVDSGADALGFVFYEKSPRVISSERAHEIVRKLPSHVEKVGVFVDPSESAIAIAEASGLTAVQAYYGFNGRQTPAPQSHFSSVSRPNPRKVYFAFPVERLLDTENRIEVNFSSFTNSGELTPQNPVAAVFLDSGTALQPGGTGKTFDWRRAAPLINDIRRSVKVVIAGGLTPGNVAEAIGSLKPWGVDVSSGVEATPGKKDPEKMRAFVRAVRETEGKVN